MPAGVLKGGAHNLHSQVLGDWAFQLRFGWESVYAKGVCFWGACDWPGLTSFSPFPFLSPRSRHYASVNGRPKQRELHSDGDRRMNPNTRVRLGVCRLNSLRGPWERGVLSPWLHGPEWPSGIVSRGSHDPLQHRRFQTEERHITWTAAALFICWKWRVWSMAK